MNICSRESMLAALDVLIPLVCDYSHVTESPRCDCKFGIGAKGKRSGEQNGCPELRSARDLIRQITDEEWDLLTWRSGGQPSGMEGFNLHNLASMLHSADAAASMAQANIAKVREAIATYGNGGS